jgi:hypothetical protein
MMAKINGKKNLQLVTNHLPNLIYESQHPFLRPYDDQMFGASNFSKWTETRYFDPSQIQELMPSEHSDKIWSVTQTNIHSLESDI